MEKSSRRADAFTLVELLVAVGIIALLIALLFPTLSRARQHANRVKCAANLRSIGHAMAMYTAHYRYYPGAAALYEDIGGYGYAVWPTRLRPFLGGEHGAFYCPAQDERCEWRKDAPPRGPVGRASEAESRFGYEIGESLITTGSWSTGDTPFSYGYNHFGAYGTYYSGKGTSPTHYGLGLATNETSAGRIGGELPATRVRRPSEMIAVTDSTVDGKSDFLINPIPESQVGPGAVHNGGANVLYCDGHVQWHLLREVTLPATVDTPEAFRESRRIIRLWNNNNRHAADP